MNTNRIFRGISKRYNWNKEFRQYRDILSKNAGLAQTKNGKTCFIIGNGPSLKNQDLTLLADKETFVVNSFWYHKQYELIRPKFYVVVDLPDLSQENKPLRRYQGDIPGRDPVVSKVPETKLFFSAKIKNYIESKGLFKNNPKYYLLQQDIMGPKLNFNLDITKPVPYTRNTIVLALMVAIYLGFEKIYLLGCDHNFLDHPVGTHYEHFYEESDADIPDELKTGTYEGAMESCLRLFRNYRFLKEKIAKTNPNVKIFNATPNSFLDVFPMVDFDEVLKRELV